MASKARAVVRAHVARRQHAGDEHRDMARLEPLEHRLERAAGQLGIDPSQGVVGAELEDHGLGAVGDRPVEPREAAGGGVARHSGIGDLRRDALGGERPLELCRKRRIDGKAVAGGERVAEGDDPQRPIGCERGRAHRRARQHDGHDRGGTACSHARAGYAHDNRDRAAHLPYPGGFPI